MKLSTRSIAATIRNLEKYKQKLIFQCTEFVSRLADIGIQTIDANKVSEGTSNFDDLQTFVLLGSTETGGRATLILRGKDVAFIEFGAGVHFNGSPGESPNPFGADLGYTIGSYGLGLGVNDSWEYRDPETGERKISQGTKAAMPMAKADVEIKKQFETIAREVFK